MEIIDGKQPENSNAPQKNQQIIEKNKYIFKSNCKERNFLESINETQNICSKASYERGTNHLILNRNVS